MPALKTASKSVYCELSKLLICTSRVHQFGDGCIENYVRGPIRIRHMFPLGFVIEGTSSSSEHTHTGHLAQSMAERSRDSGGL